MPVKKDDSGRRWVEMEFLVPGTPEQVWQAIATGPGMSAWFTPTIVDERVGGAITFDSAPTTAATPRRPDRLPPGSRRRGSPTRSAIGAVTHRRWQPRSSSPVTRATDVSCHGAQSVHVEG